MASSPVLGSLADAYARANPRSHELYERQREVVPLGITHSTRLFEPFPLFIRACRGARKWDVDGHEYLDYWLGHGSFLLGHAHPVVNEAIAAQLPDGMHAGGETEIGLRWAELVRDLVPAAESVRFTSSGGEATQLALRVARAYTGRTKAIKFRHHFHGWHDAVAPGVYPPWEVPMAPGIAPGALADTIVLPGNDIGAVRAALAGDDVALVILEPGGGFSDTVPTDFGYLAELRELTREAGAILIFDEVVTGFRYAVGGVQELTGVTPDLATLGKVVGGGLPAGALVGRAEVMAVLDTTGDRGRDRRERIPQYGTWNAMPVVAAAGVAALGLIADGEPTRIANERADQLREGLNEVFAAAGLAAVAYGRSSIWKTYLGERPRLLDGDLSAAAADGERLAQGWGALGESLRQALLLEGVDVMRTQGFTSAVHTEAEIDATVEAFARAIARLRAAGLLGER
ncbi:MAG: aminotransferase class III-fold pyridoxal phosphate-dependent enzyme [Actinobacteria bacterium]|nr:aminotransferase class III-fold pyridoxal phosphate-dependent enzyme [Actinomycetota bacterium]